MRHFFIVVLFFAIHINSFTCAANGRMVFVKNKNVKIVFKTETGCFDIINIITGDTVVNDAFFQAGGLLSKNPHEKISTNLTSVETEFGKGQALKVRIHFADYADMLWKAVLYEQEDFVELSLGIANDTDRPYLLKQYFPFVSPDTYKGKKTDDSFLLLDGNSGGNNTHVRDTSQYLSFNNLMFQFGKGDSSSIFVAGGLTYHDFEKFVEVKRGIGKRIISDRIAVKLFAEDPVGKTIPPQIEYMSDERFYVCFHNNNPFEALEKYGMPPMAVNSSHQLFLVKYGSV